MRSNNNTQYAVDEIKSRLTMSDLIRAYLPHVKPRRGRIPCPLHNGKNFNFSFCDGAYICFVCGASGDVISFVQELFSLSFPAALDKLNTDFCLGIVTGRKLTMREQRIVEQKRQERIAERERLPLPRRDVLELWAKVKKWTVEQAKELSALRNNKDGLTVAQLYAQAISQLNYLDYVLDSTQTETLDDKTSDTLKKELRQGRYNLYNDYNIYSNNHITHKEVQLG